MAKIILASDEMEKRAQKIAQEMGFGAKGMKLAVLGLNKSKEVTKVAKATEVIEYFSQDQNLILLYIYERAFDKVDEQTQDLWIKIALNKVCYDMEKDKIEIVDDIRNIIAMHHQYQDVIIQKIELGLLTIEQIVEEDKQAKAEAAALKASHKKRR